MLEDLLLRQYRHRRMYEWIRLGARISLSTITILGSFIFWAGWRAPAGTMPAFACFLTVYLLCLIVGPELIAAFALSGQQTELRIFGLTVPQLLIMGVALCLAGWASSFVPDSLCIGYLPARYLVGLLLAMTGTAWAIYPDLKGSLRQQKK